MINKDCLPSRPSKSLCFLLMGLLFCVYALENSPIPLLLGNQMFSFIIKPILWLGIAFVVYKLPNIRSQLKIKHRSSINLWAFNFAVIYIVISICIGLFDGLGKSPYSHSLSGVLMNVLYVGSVLLGKELARGWIVNNFTKQENYAIFIFIALFMTFIGFPVDKFMELKDIEGIVKFTAQYFAPDFSHNLFAVYLVYLGGPLPAFIYMGVLQAFTWLSPILPDLQWLTAGLIGIMCPVFFLTAIQNINARQSKLLKRKDQEQEGILSWIVTSLISIGIIWFSVGVFPIYPSVIATGSMEPMIMPGDVILVRKLKDIREVQVGDVIQFRRDSILISHRVMEIREDEKKGVSYLTKGDNNSSSDKELVKPENLKGEIIKVVPKIGWPTLLIKSNKDIKLDEIEF